MMAVLEASTVVESSSMVVLEASTVVESSSMVVPVLVAVAQVVLVLLQLLPLT